MGEKLDATSSNMNPFRGRVQTLNTGVNSVTTIPVAAEWTLAAVVLFLFVVCCEIGTQREKQLTIILNGKKSDSTSQMLNPSGRVQTLNTGANFVAMIPCRRASVDSRFRPFWLAAGPPTRHTSLSWHF